MSTQKVWVIKEKLVLQVEKADERGFYPYTPRPTLYNPIPEPSLASELFVLLGIAPAIGMGILWVLIALTHL